MNVKIEIAEGLVVGPDETLIVTVKDAVSWSEATLDDLSDELRSVVGDRFIIIAGDVEIAKVETK